MDTFLTNIVLYDGEGMGFLQIHSEEEMPFVMGAIMAALCEDTVHHRVESKGFKNFPSKQFDLDLPSTDAQRLNSTLDRRYGELRLQRYRETVHLELPLG